MKKARQYVSWSRKEMLKVRTLSEELLELNPTLSILRAVRLAQEELPPSRHMKLVQLGRIPYELRAHLDRQYPNRPILRNATVVEDANIVWPASIHKAIATPAPAPAPALEISSPVPSPRSQLLNLVGDSAEVQLLALLADDNVRAALALLTEAIEAKLRTTSTPTTAIVEDVTSTGAIDSKPRLPIVVVAGLEPKQVHSLNRALENLPPFKFALAFWVKDESRDRLRDLCRKATKVIVITKFISHSVFDTIKALVSRNNIIYCNGSVSTLLDPILSSLALSTEWYDSSSLSPPITGSSSSA